MALPRRLMDPTPFGGWITAADRPYARPSHKSNSAQQRHAALGPAVWPEYSRGRLFAIGCATVATIIGVYIVAVFWFYGICGPTERGSGSAARGFGRLHRRLHPVDAKAVAVAARDRRRSAFRRCRRDVGDGHGRTVRVLNSGGPPAGALNPAPAVASLG